MQKAKKLSDEITYDEVLAEVVRIEEEERKKQEPPPGSITINQLAASLGLPRTTARNRLDALVRKGRMTLFVSSERQRRFYTPSSWGTHEI